MTTFRSNSIGLDDLTHTLFSIFPGLQGQRAWKIEIVIKAVINSRANGNFTLRKFLQHRLGHDMCSRVPIRYNFEASYSAFLSIILPPKILDINPQELADQVTDHKGYRSNSQAQDGHLQEALAEGLVFGDGDV